MIEDTTCSYSGELTQMESYVSVPASSYENLVVAHHVAVAFSETVADEWKEANENGFGGPSDSLKAILRLWDPALYNACVLHKAEKQREAEKNFKDLLEKEPLTPGPIYPYNPYNDDQGMPYKGEEITCEDTSAEHE